MHLNERDRRILAGEAGRGPRLALGLITKLGEALGAPSLRSIEAAHIDGTLYHGQAALDFAERLAEGGTQVSVPTTLNVGSLDLIHPELYRGDPQTRERAKRLMDAYAGLGCQATWTCAPYLLTTRPGLGDQVAFGESNAIAFVNSVLGARTERYGDFVDACAAVAGRVPDFGLHRPENRRGELVFRLDAVPERLRREDVFYPVLGHLVGRRAGTAIPVICDLPAETTEDQLKAFGAAAASSGAVALFHAVGITPEAPNLEAACGGEEPRGQVEVTPSLLRRARDELTTLEDGALAAVSLGTPHFSLDEVVRVAELLDGAEVHQDLDLYVSTGRQNLAPLEQRGIIATLDEAGVTLVVDTCTYVTPILRPRTGFVMTNSAKWAYYAPANLGLDVAFGSLEECVRSAVVGRVWRDVHLWEGI